MFTITNNMTGQMVDLSDIDASNILLALSRERIASEERGEHAFSDFLRRTTEKVRNIIPSPAQ